MDITLKTRYDEAAFKYEWQRAFYALAAPAYIQVVLDIMLLLELGHLLPYLYGQLARGAALVLLVIAFSWFPRTWRAYREIYRKNGTFDNPTVIRLTDSFMEISCGGDESKYEYRVFSGYMRWRGRIILTVENTLSAVFPWNGFPDGGAEFAQCLEKAGVKEIPFFSFERWWHLCVPVALLLAVETELAI